MSISPDLIRLDMEKEETHTTTRKRIIHIKMDRRFISVNESLEFSRGLVCVCVFIPFQRIVHYNLITAKGPERACVAATGVYLPKWAGSLEMYREDPVLPRGPTMGFDRKT